MRGAFLGPAYSSADIERFLTTQGARYVRLPERELLDRVADELAEGKVVGWFQGRMEFGPRALGGRSILGDARNPQMQSVMNLKIKYRESFRPFAPSVLRERVSHYFELDTDSPYMLMVAPVRSERRTATTPDHETRWGIDRLNLQRSDVPAVTHVDYSARIQTVDAATNPRYHALLKAFEAKTGLRCARQYVVQRSGGADRVYPRRRLPMLHADGDGYPGGRELSLGEGRSETPHERHRLAP